MGSPLISPSTCRSVFLSPSKQSTRNNRCAISIVGCLLFLSSCSTTINSLTSTTSVSQASSTTIATPTGDIISLVTQLGNVANGLGEAVVDRNSQLTKQKLAEADAIWIVLEPQIRASGLDLVESLQQIVDLMHSAVEKKRPADADKALRFVPLITEALALLLKK